MPDPQLMIVITDSHCFQFTFIATDGERAKYKSVSCQVGKIQYGCFSVALIFNKVFVLDISSRLDLIPLALQPGRVPKCWFDIINPCFD